jgi:hypothetical protein
VALERSLPRLEHISQFDRLQLEEAGRRLAEAAQECSRIVAHSPPPSTLDGISPDFGDIVEAFEKLQSAQESFWEVWWEACGVPP